jgi:hypothetical protein
MLAQLPASRHDAGAEGAAPPGSPRPQPSVVHLSTATASGFKATGGAAFKVCPSLGVEACWP